MDKLLVIYWIFPIIIGFIISQYTVELMHIVKFKLVGAKYQLVIGILSARNHFDERRVIRETWLKNIKQNTTLSDRIDVKFIVGDRPCELATNDRLDPLSCERWKVSLRKDTSKEWQLVKEIDGATGLGHNYPVQSLTFKVEHAIVVDKLGIHDSSIGQLAVVRLIDTVRQTEITSVEFDEKKRGRLINSFRYKPVEAFLLPKGLECSIEADNLQGGSLKLPITDQPIRIQTDNASGVIHFQQVVKPVPGHYSEPLIFSANQIPVVSLIFKIHNLDELKSHISNGTARDDEHMRTMVEERRRLDEEQLTHGDLVFVDMLDVYRNLPRKLLAFLQWLSSDVLFEYAMKTDDDCYVDIDSILSQLDTHSTHSKLWWGRFRHNWLVEHHGKWREPVLPSLTYPAFACGSGHVMSGDLVKWLADSTHMLHAYQGEDVSLGIWLSAVAPHYVDDYHWLCENECLSDMYVMPQLNPEQLRSTWNNKQTCGDPCGCS